MYPFIFSYSALSIIVLRLVFGLILAIHGWPKISNVKKNAVSFDGMGFKPGKLWGTITALVEFIGGLMIIFGILSGFAAFLVAIQFGVIIVWKLSKNMPFVGGWELDLLAFAVAVVIMAFSAGHIGMPHMMGYRY